MARRTLVGVVAVLVALTALPAAAHDDPGYDLPDPGVLLEGIGVDRIGRVFYVSGVNDGGDIYRGTFQSDDLTRWVDGEGTTGRGIDVDRFGNVYVAGGPTGTVRIFDRSGSPIATVSNGSAGSFLNDVWVGPDGTVYVTDSSIPILWQVTEDGAAGWSIEPFLDLSDDIGYTPPTTDFDVGGIVATPDGRFLLLSQGTTGQLWRVEIAGGEIVEVDLGGAAIPNADGIVLRGHRLWVVQNFLRQISLFRLDGSFESATLDDVIETPSDRTLTTAALFNGRLLAVDSQFGFAPETAAADDRVVRIHPNR